MVFNGHEGLSQKAPGEGNASYYYSNTRMPSTGMLRIKNKEYVVSGLSWLDREWSTSVLGRNQIGWDWFSLQLDNGTELMLFNIRENDGDTSPFSSGSFIERDGSKQHLEKTQFTVSVTDHWRSPETNIRYPAGWEISIPRQNMVLSVTPLMSNQEHRHRFMYWEGAVDVTGKGLSGKGYVELTGYGR